ncbi:hypothetical protein RDABS01_019821 [Bienertia sinuspersici]
MTVFIPSFSPFFLRVKNLEEREKRKARERNKREEDIASRCILRTSKRKSLDMGGHMSKKAAESSTEYNNLQYITELTSYEAACKTDADLQSFDANLHARRIM